ncbi:MAG: hypothetical protein Q4D79_02620 [Propionibacteriaceae bacterium]|nr:hypothetical protein [Propionibacteriaceae bacterium]
MATPLGGLAAASVGRLAAHAESGTPALDRRIFTAAFEDITNGAERLRQLADRFSQVGVDEIAVSIGRIDQALFPWEGQLPPQSESQKDFVKDAIDVLSGDGSSPRPVIFLLDALIPKLIEESPELGGIGADGTRSEDHPSLTALTRGVVGERIVELAAVAARRYQPAAISLTELFFGDTTYGDDDLADFEKTTGATGWPTKEGKIDTADERIVAWRCQALAELVGRVREAVNSAADNRPELWVEVKAPREDANADRKDSGHDYDLLMAQADRLVLWCYFDEITDKTPSTQDLAAAFVRRTGGAGIVSIGLWKAKDSNKNDIPITPEELSTAVKDAISGGSSSSWVTPPRLMSEAHWQTLAEAWQQ